MSLWRMLGFDPNREPPAGRGDAVRAIVDSLDQLDPERARHIAAFAYILGRVANVDLEVSREETRAMERIVRELGGISDEESVLVVRIAKTQHALFGSTEGYVVTREFSRFATQEEKESLLECLFAVSAADQEVSAPASGRRRASSRQREPSTASLPRFRTSTESVAASPGQGTSGSSAAPRANARRTSG